MNENESKYQEIKDNLFAFRMELLKKMPFYGDVLMHLSFVENNQIPTAATDGKRVYYNPEFMAQFPFARQNFIWMHEILHILLMHGIRCGKRDQYYWNVAGDLLINQMLLQLEGNMKRAGIPFEKEPSGLFAPVDIRESAESLYERIFESVGKSKKRQYRIVLVPNRRIPSKKTLIDIPVDFGDLLEVYGESADKNKVSTIRIEDEDKVKEIQDFVMEIIKKAAEKGQNPFGHFFIPGQIYEFMRVKPLNWKSILKKYLMDIESDEVSYFTPERKYIHMDLILPGHGEHEEYLEEIWAFVDCSGSVGKEEMEKFLGQLYYICKEFHCTLNICFWDTVVDTVYKKIRKKEDIAKCIPTHTGGTNINCVYRWIKENKVKPGVMLILTDGMFGKLNTADFIPGLKKKTILVLSSDYRQDDMKAIGRIASLK